MKPDSGTAYDLNLSSNAVRVVPGIGINGQVTEKNGRVLVAETSGGATIIQL